MPLGRPSKLTAELQREIVKHIRLGNYVETAAALSGIDKGTFYRWLKRGKAEQERISRGGRPLKREDPYLEFYNAIEKARAQVEADGIAMIMRAGLKQWQAVAWRMERMFPEKWGYQRDGISAKVLQQLARKLALLAVKYIPVPDRDAFLREFEAAISEVETVRGKPVG